jgi:hypothetical protein
MWTQAARWMVGGTMPGNLVPNIYFRSGKAYVSVDAIDRDGEMITDAVIKANVAFPEGDINELDLFQVAPGRYEASVDATQIGSYFVNIYQEDGEGNMTDQVSSGYSVSFPPEYEKSGPDMFLLSQLVDATGGQLQIEPAAVFSHTNQPVSHYFDLWYYLLMAAICLLPFDIALRRLSLTGESLEFVRNKVAGYITEIRERRSSKGISVSHIEQLKKVKEEYRLTSARPEFTKSDLDVDKRIGDILSHKTAEKSQKSFYRPPADISKNAERTQKEPEKDDSSLKSLLKAKKRIWDENKKDEKD